jgi:hypothetical protein
MSRARLHDAFLAGFAPPMAGLYFNGLELLGEADRWSDVALGRRIGDERERVIGRRDEALARLDQSERLLADLGADPIVRPEDSSEYAAWAEGAFDAVAGVLSGDPDEAVAHLLGFVLGEAIATLDVMASLSRLRELAPENMWMRVQAESLERERQTAERRLGRLAVHQSLPERARTASALAAHVVSEAVASDGDRAGRSLIEHAASIESALRQPGTG